MPYFNARVRCTVIKSVYCDAETADQVRDHLWEHALDEHDLDQIDWDVLSVESAE